MKLIRIELKNFKRFSFTDFPAPFTFSPGINVVKGPLNETGKSTLLKGIVAALFYDVKSVKEEVKDCFSWGQDRRCETLVEFEEKEKTYSLHKDFEKKLVSFIGHNTGEIFDTSKKVSIKMKELLGTDSDEFFSLTSCIYQDQVEAISRGKKQISDSLEEVVTGGKEGILASQAMKKLGDKVSEMRKGLGGQAKNLGILASLTKDLQNTLQRYDEVKEEVSKVEAQKIKLVDVNKQLANVKERYENVKTLLDNNEKLKKIEESINRLRDKYGDVKKQLDGINQLITKLEGSNEALSSIEGFEDEQQVSEFRRKLDAIQNKRGDIEEDLARLEKELAEAKGNLGRRKVVRFFGSGKGIATSIIILTGGIIGASVVSLYFLSLVILGTVILAITMWARTAFVQDKTNISGIEERVQKMKKALSELDKEEQELLVKAKCNTVGAFDKKERDFQTSLKDRGELEAQLKGMLGGKRVEDFQKQETEIATDLAVEKVGLTDDLKATALSPEKQIEKKREFQSLEREKNGLETGKMECVITIKQARFNIEDQIRLEEERYRLGEALTQEEKRVKIYELAKDCISKARDEALSSIIDILKDGIQEYFEIFTSGKYKQVDIKKDDKGDLEFWIRSDEKGGLAKPEELSGGVIDEFYLACRLALVKLIFGDKKPPLLLDDPFGNFDSIRLANTLGFLKTLASDYQIIIFTLGDLYDKVADNIIVLSEKERLS